MRGDAAGVRLPALDAEQRNRANAATYGQTPENTPKRTASLFAEYRLSGVPGLADVTVQGDRVSATLLGDVAPFVRAVASPELLDLTIEPASLEEAFLEYYADADDSPAAPRPEAQA